jgi:site-specific recombinase XerD
MEPDKPKNHYEPVGDLVSIFRRGRTWYANFQRDGKQQRPSLKTASKKQARRKAIRLEAELLEGRYQPVPTVPTLAAVIKDYTAFLRTERRAAKTLTKYQKVFDRLADLAERRRVRTLDGVTLKVVDAYRSERAQAGVAAKTLYTETVVVRQLVNFALSRNLLPSDPLKGLRLKKPKHTPQPCWTPAQVERILQASREPERSRFVVLADTGMRVGELRHLTWDDVDFDHNVLHIRPKDGWQPKTKDQRAIPMSPRVGRLLQSLPRRGRWMFPAARSSKYPAGDHQFSDRHLLAALKRVLARLGLAGHVHTFRHAFVSHALTRGIPEAIVRQWVGHVDAEVIQWYTHIADASSQEAMQRLANETKGRLQPGRKKGPTGGNSALNQHNAKENENDRGAK